MARFLLACYPVSGHLNPNLAVASALRARGHEVAIYSGALAREAVQGEGFTYFPYDQAIDQHLMPIWFPDPKNTLASDIPIERSAWRKVSQIKATLREWFLSTVPQQVEDLRAIIRQWQPDLLVTDISLFGPILVLQESADIPIAAFCVLLACPLPGPDAPVWGRGLPPPRGWVPRLRSRVEQALQDWVLKDFRLAANALRSQYGLKPIKESVMGYSGHLPLFLVAGAPELDYSRHDLPPSVHYVGPCLWHRAKQEAPPDWLTQLPRGRPMVYVTEGTVHVGEPTLLRSAAQGLGPMDIDLVMTTGKHRDPADLRLGGAGPNVRVERYVPHGDLFPRTDVVVTTGGPGTVLAALVAGVPVVIVPTGWDHAENAQRIVEAKVGVRLDLQDCTPQRLRSAVETLLRDPSYRQNAGRMGAALERQGGPLRAAELLEELLNRSSVTR